MDELTCTAGRTQSAGSRGSVITQRRSVKYRPMSRNTGQLELLIQKKSTSSLENLDMESDSGSSEIESDKSEEE